MDTTTTKKSKKSKITKLNVYFTIFVLAWTLLVTVASQFIIAQILVIFLGEKVSQPFWTLIYYLLTYAVTIPLVILVPPQLVKIYQKQHTKTTTTSDKLIADLQTTPTSLGVQNLPTFVDIGLAPIGYIVYVFFANIIVKIMESLPWFDANQAQDVGFNYITNTPDRICAMLAVVFIAPIAEEIIMRGWLYGKVRSRIKNIPLAIILVSLLFAVLHGQWNVGVTVFVLSVILCTLREITGTIWSGILLHILANGIAFYMLYITL